MGPQRMGQPVSTTTVWPACFAHNDLATSNRVGQGRNKWAGVGTLAFFIWGSPGPSQSGKAPNPTDAIATVLGPRLR